MYKEAAVFYPQDEMTTVLVPVTTGCSYNRCVFCSMYKDEEYKEVPLTDIEMILMNGYKYTERVFLTGADPMSIGFDKMMKILNIINKHLPYCAQVSSYASIKNIAKYSVEELDTLRTLGLRLLYIGFETGRDDVLKLMNKAHTVDDAIKQAKKLNKAHLQFNTIIMYGIAGAGECINNARETARMINEFETRKIITMSLTVFENTELQNLIDKGEFIQASRTERLTEIKTLLEELNPKKETIFDTTHATNIINIKGRLPQEKNRLISELSRRGV